MRLTRKEINALLIKFKDHKCCSDICSADKDWSCGYRSINHIKECKKFKLKEKV